MRSRKSNLVRSGVGVGSSLEGSRNPQRGSGSGRAGPEGCTGGDAEGVHCGRIGIFANWGREGRKGEKGEEKCVTTI